MRENKDHNNSEYGHFSRSVCYEYYQKSLNDAFTTNYMTTLIVYYRK